MKRLDTAKEKIYEMPALLWKRFAAFFIDMAIINFVILSPFGSLFENLMPKYSSFSSTREFLNSLASENSRLSSIFFVMFAFIFFYFLLLEKKMGQTIGKKIMKIHVVGTEDAASGWQFYVRNLAFIPFFPFILLWIIDPLMMIFYKTNQRLSEILSKTRVIERYNIVKD